MHQQPMYLWVSCRINQDTWLEPEVGAGGIGIQGHGKLEGIENNLEDFCLMTLMALKPSLKMFDSTHWLFRGSTGEP